MDPQADQAQSHKGSEPQANSNASSPSRDKSPPRSRTPISREALRLRDESFEESSVGLGQMSPSIQRFASSMSDENLSDGIPEREHEHEHERELEHGQHSQHDPDEPNPVDLGSNVLSSATERRHVLQHARTSPPATPLELGTRALLDKNSACILRFVGTVDSFQGTMYGVELLDAKGNTDGQFESDGSQGLREPQGRTRAKSDVAIPRASLMTVEETEDRRASLGDLSCSTSQDYYGNVKAVPSIVLTGAGGEDSVLVDGKACGSTIGDEDTARSAGGSPPRSSPKHSETKTPIHHHSSPRHTHSSPGNSVPTSPDKSPQRNNAQIPSRATPPSHAARLRDQEVKGPLQAILRQLSEASRLPYSPSSSDGAETLDGLQFLVDDLVQQRDDALSRAEVLTNQAVDKAVQIANLTRSHQELTNNLDSHLKHLKQVEASVVEKDEDLRLCKEHITVLEDKLGALDSEGKTFSAPPPARYQRELDAQASHISKLRMENEELRKELEAAKNLTQKVDNPLRPELEAAQQTILSLESQLEQVRSVSSSQYADRLRQENDRLRRRLAALETGNATANQPASSITLPDTEDRATSSPHPSKQGASDPAAVAARAMSPTHSTPLRSVTSSRPRPFMSPALMRMEKVLNDSIEKSLRTEYGIRQRRAELSQSGASAVASPNVTRNTADGSSPFQTPVGVSAGSPHFSTGANGAASATGEAALRQRLQEVEARNRHMERELMQMRLERAAEHASLSVTATGSKTEGKDDSSNEPLKAQSSGDDRSMDQNDDSVLQQVRGFRRHSPGSGRPTEVLPGAPAHQTSTTGPDMDAAVQDTVSHGTASMPNQSQGASLTIEKLAQLESQVDMISDQASDKPSNINGWASDVARSRADSDDVRPTGMDEDETNAGESSRSGSIDIRAARESHGSLGSAGRSRLGSNHRFSGSLLVDRKISQDNASTDSEGAASYVRDDEDTEDDMEKRQRSSFVDLNDPDAYFESETEESEDDKMHTRTLELLAQFHQPASLDVLGLDGANSVTRSALGVDDASVTSLSRTNSDAIDTLSVRSSSGRPSLLVDEASLASRRSSLESVLSLHGVAHLHDMVCKCPRRPGDCPRLQALLTQPGEQDRLHRQICRLKHVATDCPTMQSILQSMDIAIAPSPAGATETTSSPLVNNVSVHGRSRPSPSVARRQHSLAESGTGPDTEPGNLLRAGQPDDDDEDGITPTGTPTGTPTRGSFSTGAGGATPVHTKRDDVDFEDDEDTDEEEANREALLALQSRSGKGRSRILGPTKTNNSATGSSFGLAGEESETESESSHAIGLSRLRQLRSSGMNFSEASSVMEHHHEESEESGSESDAGDRLTELQRLSKIQLRRQDSATTVNSVQTDASKSTDLPLSPEPLRANRPTWWERALTKSKERNLQKALTGEGNDTVDNSESSPRLSRFRSIHDYNSESEQMSEPEELEDDGGAELLRRAAAGPMRRSSSRSSNVGTKPGAAGEGTGKGKQGSQDASAGPATTTAAAAAATPAVVTQNAGRLLSAAKTLFWVLAIVLLACLVIGGIAVGSLHFVIPHLYIPFV
ncbi:uncharacterized protein MONBRDRAFT_9958 [Monosiga brevicollis MX1]|uniref:CAP-Gly domain-containing protein n=1 Tax=Monosiga brevicollis TaxID=81824 RepID=A9V4R7_MONBE|nr:uncharacterized protein MONBRDRAFT_9958 [Monosiga brevicollis MX1]EDQ87418.1 predicted protein [Monosiga brevicollis MX1]|eukprot:XP_001747678.1 hypothetical protein [Monosiga brevicollis MX1]